jgi:hypothetical protein
MVFPNFQRQARLTSGWPAEYRLSPNEDLPGHCQGIHQALSNKILPNGTLGLKTEICVTRKSLTSSSKTWTKLD